MALVSARSFVLRLLIALILPILSFTLVAVMLLGWGSRVILEGTERQQIAFYAQQRPGITSAIYLMDVPRTLTQRLYSSPDWVFSMAWSPDGEQIAFIVQEQNTYRLYVMDADGQHPRLVTDQAASSQPIHWSPDSRQIIFESYVATTTALYIVDFASGEIHSLMDSANVISTDFAWSPGFEQAAFATLMPNSGALDIYTVPAECVMQSLNCRAEQITNSVGNDFAPAWSADGSRLAFVSDRQGPQQVYITDVCEEAATGCERGEQLLAPPTVNDFTLSWSPDDRWLAFSVYTNGGGLKLYLADMQCQECTPRFHNLTPSTEEDIFAVWSADSRYFIHVKRHQSIMADIALLDIGCTETAAGCADASRSLTHNLYAWYPIWRP